MAGEVSRNPLFQFVGLLTTVPAVEKLFRITVIYIKQREQRYQVDTHYFFLIFRSRG